jgi:hypothetical protein
MNFNPSRDWLAYMNDVLAPVLFFDSYSRLAVLEKVCAQI